VLKLTNEQAALQKVTLGSRDERTGRLTPKDEREVTQSQVSNRVREAASRVVGLSASIGAGGGGGENRKEIQLQLRGPDLDVLNQLAGQVEDQIRAVPGVVDVGLSTSGRRPEITVDVKRGVAADRGISVADIAAALRPGFAGIDVGDWIDPEGETRDVYVRLAPSARETAADIASLPVLVQQGQTAVTVPLAQVVEIRRGIGPAQIEHIDRDRVIAVQANTLDRPLSEVMKDINSRIEGITLPAGYTLTTGGDVEDQQDVFSRIFTALTVALLLMYFVLVIQFGSFLDPVSILISLPLSLIGVMLALLITGGTLNLMSLIEVMLLMGIVAKNAILLIDFAKWSEGDGKPRHEALIEACSSVRFS
jgi:HAE1 family hydrophobic/amphiphilic exporter-1